MLKPLIQFRSRNNAIYLTFDDGPHPDYTPRILDTLAAYQAKATFFVVGEKAERYPGIVERMCAEGHYVANHTFRHMSLLFKPLATIRQDILRADRIIAGITGSKPFLFRPPYGRFGVNLLRFMLENEQRIVLWSCSTKDYKTNLQADSISEKISRACPGSILLLHDGHRNSKTTALSLKKALQSEIALPLKALE